MPSVSVGGGQEATKRMPDKIAKYTIDLEEMNKAEKALETRLRAEAAHR